MLGISKGVFITGTDTDVGKTIITCGIIKYMAKRGFKVAGMKPVASGCFDKGEGLRNKDAEMIQEAMNIEVPYDQINPYTFEEPIAPHIAAEKTSTDISIDYIKEKFDKLGEISEAIVVEGVGGWLVPLKDDIGIDDLVLSLKLPVIMVVDVKLGCINHALLTCENILDKGLFLAGWVANSTSNDQIYVEEQIDSLTKRIPAPMFGRIPYKEGISSDEVCGLLRLPF